jgi:hypothetical protein
MLVRVQTMFLTCIRFQTSCVPLLAYARAPRTHVLLYRAKERRRNVSNGQNHAIAVLSQFNEIALVLQYGLAVGGFSSGHLSHHVSGPRPGSGFENHSFSASKK